MLFANKIIDKCARPVDFLHMLSPHNRFDDEWFAPLAELAPGPDVLLGVIHCAMVCLVPLREPWLLGSILGEPDVWEWQQSVAWVASLITVRSRWRRYSRLMLLPLIVSMRSRLA